MNKFAYSPNNATQQSGVYYQQDLRKSGLRVQEDREQQLNHMFSQFQQDFTFDELIQFLDHWVNNQFAIKFLKIKQQNKSIYDRNIAEQLFQECYQENKRIQARDFINQFVDTERNLHFRINYQQSEMDELVNQKNQLIQSIKSQSTNSNKVILQILQAKNLEQTDRYITIDSFVQIKIDGQNAQTTQMIPNNANPQWNETFTLDIVPNTLEIVLVVNDRIRLLKQDEIGRVIINLAELQQKKQITKEAYLLHGGLRTQSTLLYNAQYLFSEAKLIQEKIKAKEDEIQQMRENMKPNQLILAKLTELFSENKGSNNNLEHSRSYQGANLGYGAGSGHYDMSKSVNMMNLSAYYFPTIKEQKFEQKILEKLDKYTSVFIDDWTKISIIFLISTICLCVIQCLYKPQFLELTILLVFMCLCFSGILTHTQHRFMSITLIVSWFYDIVWLVFLSKEWYGFGGSSKIDNTFKTFVIIISIVSTVLSKFPLIVCMWRAYFNFDRFKEQIMKIKMKSLQQNTFGQGSSQQNSQAKRSVPIANANQYQKYPTFSQNTQQQKQILNIPQSPYINVTPQYQQPPIGYYTTNQQQQQIQQPYSSRQQNDYVYH